LAPVQRDYGVLSEHRAYVVLAHGHEQVRGVTAAGPRATRVLPGDLALPPRVDHVLHAAQLGFGDDVPVHIAGTAQRALEDVHVLLLRVGPARLEAAQPLTIVQHLGEHERGSEWVENALGLELALRTG